MYINLDNNYNASVLSDSRKWSAYRVARYNDGYWGTIPDAKKYLKSFNISDYSCDGSNITMGCVCGSKIVIDFKNAPTSFANELTEGTQITVYLSLKGDATETSSSQLNTIPYVIDEAKVVPIMNGRNITVTAYDLSYLMTHKYVSAYENPTALEIVTEIANKYGLGVDVSVSEKIQELGSSLANATFKPLADFTCKETLGFIAGCFGCNAKVGVGRKIYFEWYETSSMPDISKDIVYLGGSTLSEQFVVKMIETGTQENPIVYPNNTQGYSINFENPYITADHAKAIYDNKIANNKISFRSGKIKYKGNPINTPNKIVTTTDITNTPVSFYIMKRTLNYDGGLSETIECLGESETTINYKVNSPTQQRINRALSKMEEAIKKSTDVITQTQGSTFELIPVDENDATQGNAGFKIHYEDTGSSAFDDCVIMGTAGGVGLSTNNGETFATAMYFYEDEDTGEIHGAINGEVIRAGSISADKIDTSQLVVSKENIDGLDAELAELLEVANEADKKAGNAQTTANTANSNANTAKTNASNALSVANTANGKVASWASANDTTLIDGAKIYTGSITAKQIEANAITADKLNVGVAKRANLLYNYDYDVVTSNKTIDGWEHYGGKVYPQSGGWFAFVPSSTGSSGFMQRAWLTPGRYALVTRMNFVNVSSVSDEAAVGYILDKSQKVFEDAQIIGNAWYKDKNSNHEILYKQVFEYTGDAGYVNVGVHISGFAFANYLSSAWCILYETTDNTGFYASDKNLLKDNYKTSNLIQYISSPLDAVPYIDTMTIDSKNGLDVVGGKVGAFDFTEVGLSVESHVPFVGLEGGLDSYLKVEKALGGTAEKYGSSLIESSRSVFAHIELGLAGEQFTVLSPEAIYCGDAYESDYSYITSGYARFKNPSGTLTIYGNGININGTFISNATLLNKLSG